MTVNRLTEKLTFQGTQQEHHKHRLLFLIDEFPSLKRMTIFARGLSYMAGFGLTAYLITQDIRQIVAEYGANESIVSNCGIRAAFTPNQYETAALLSKMTGVKTIQKASFNFSGSRGASILDHVNESLEQIRRPLLTPDEALRMPAPLKQGEGKNEKIIWPGDMLLFVAGHRPIYGRQMLYFFDEVFNARAAISPPSRPARIPRLAVHGTGVSKVAASAAIHQNDSSCSDYEPVALSDFPSYEESCPEIPFPDYPGAQV
jgi:type IV secretion system protein VirD4